MDANSSKLHNGTVPPPRRHKSPKKKDHVYRIEKSFKKSSARRKGEYTDGELFGLIRECMAKEDEEGKDYYLGHLSRSKHISFTAILQRGPLSRSSPVPLLSNNSYFASPQTVRIMKCLDELREFPGILGGLELGNWLRHLSLHCDAPIIHFLGPHIRNTWCAITNNDPDIQRHADTVTVRRLQFRVPAASSSDRRIISQMFDSGDVFKGIVDSTVRDRLKENVLALRVVIPSIASFHENMKLFSLGMKVIRTTLVGPAPRGKWLTEFLACWEPPDVPYLETSHGCLQPLAASSLTADLAFKQVFLAALRNFPYLCSESPRQDKRGECMPAYVQAPMVLYLSELASELGFKNRTIETNKEKCSKEDLVTGFTPTTCLFADWRGGRPFTKTFFWLRSHAFLTKLSRPLALDIEPSPLFILKDFMTAFFGSFESFSVDKQRFPITLSAAAAAAGNRTTSGADRLRKSRDHLRGKVQRTNKSKPPNRVEKQKKEHRSRSDKVRLENAFAYSIENRPTLSRHEHRTSSPLSVFSHNSREVQSLEPESPTADTETSMTGELTQSTVWDKPSEGTFHRDFPRSPIPSFSVSVSPLSRQQAPPTHPEMAQRARVGITKNENSQGGGFTMPARNVRSHFGHRSSERTSSGQSTVRIPPIRSMRSARQPRSGHAPFRSSPPRGSVAGLRSPGSLFRKEAGRFPATQTRTTELAAPPTPLRPQPSRSRQPWSFFGESASTSQEEGAGSPHLAPGHRFHSPANRRHAVYFDSRAERRGGAESTQLPFGRPG